MAQRSRGPASPWLVLVLVGLVAAVAIAGLLLQRSARSAGHRVLSVDINLPKAPPLPETPRLPPPPIPVPK